MCMSVLLHSVVALKTVAPLLYSKTEHDAERTGNLVAGCVSLAGVTEPGACQCFVGYTGPACTTCAHDYFRASDGQCVLYPGTVVSCSDGIRNGNEVGLVYCLISSNWPLR